MESCSKTRKIFQNTQKNRLKKLSRKIEFAEFELEWSSDRIFVWFNLTEIGLNLSNVKFYNLWGEILFVGNVNKLNLICEFNSRINESGRLYLTSVTSAAFELFNLPVHTCFNRFYFVEDFYFYFKRTFLEKFLTNGK